MPIETPASRPHGGPDPLKVGFLGLVTLYFAGSLLDPARGHLASGVVFYTHEAGHWLFAPFGTFLMFAGGTIVQLAVPLGFIASFLRQGQPFSAAVTGFWLAVSFLQASAYAGDAIALEGVLSHTWMSGQEELEEFGETRHDWHNMLDMVGLLKPGVVTLVSGALRLAGTLCFAAAVWFGLMAAGVSLPGPGGARRAT